MMRLLRISSIGFSLFFLATISNAQMGMRGGPPQFHGVFNPDVGHGAAYEIQTAKGQKVTMEVAVVGKESVDGKEGYWFETTTTGGSTGGVVMKILTVRDGANTSVSKMIMQLPGRPPMEMPSQMMQRSNQPQPADIRQMADDVGSESVTTPAGTFQCEHYRMKDGSNDVWISEKIPPYGLVKSQGKDTTMLLSKVITDAKDKITGTPQAFSPMMTGQPPQH